MQVLFFAALVGAASAGFIPFPPPLPSPVNCQYSRWTDWTECSEACGVQGTQSRTRQILVQAQGGVPCDPSLLEEWRPCLTPCKVDCQMSQWSQYSQCQSLGFGSPSCGLGQQQRSRQILVQPSNGGLPCGQTIDVQQCDLGPCPLNCQMAQWTQWSQCQSQTGQRCGSGNRQRTRQIIQQPQNGGAPCGQTEEWEQCDLGPCSVDCQMSQWSQYSQCQSLGFGSPSCGLGQQQRSRQILVQPKNGGRQCGQLTDVKQCDLGPCPQNCQMGPWGPYGQCFSQTGQQCGLGSRTRNRQIIVPASNGGFPCEPTSETEQCDLGPCAPNCIGRPVEFHINPSQPCSPSYYKCVNQQAQSLTCPSGKMFDIKTFKCLPRFQVEACF